MGKWVCSQSQPLWQPQQSGDSKLGRYLAPMTGSSWSPTLGIPIDQQIELGGIEFFVANLEPASRLTRRSDRGLVTQTIGVVICTPAGCVSRVETL